MKKKLMPLAVGAAIAASSAQAQMYINNEGTGEMLVFPFYSAEAGNTTNVNVVNTTDVAKAVKIRIIEGENSQEVLDFNVYMSAEDHFSFAITATEDGGGSLVTNDNTCTVPRLTAGEAVPFRNFLYVGDKGKDNPDTEDKDESFDNTSITRTATGYIEVIEMGQLDPDSAVIIDKTAGSTTNAAAAITHDADGVPANCQILVDAWSNITGTDGVWLAESKTGDETGDSEFMATWQGGGLYGYATVINVPTGAAFGYDAVAVSDHVAAGADGSDMHYQPGDIRPNFTDLAMDTSAIVSVDGGAVTLDFAGDYPAGVDRVQALNATIMSSEIYNDYVTDSTIGATTDWLLTFPTKAFHINGDAPIEPFSELWTGKSACEPTELSAVDREESTPPPPPEAGSQGPDFSPAPPADPVDPPKGDDVPICYEATIVQFATESAAGTSSVAIGVNEYLDASDGWATISMMPADLDSTLDGCGIDGQTVTEDPCTRTIGYGTGTLTGLPVVGFAVQKFVNGGPGATYAMATEHKSCTVGSGTASNDC